MGSIICDINIVVRDSTFITGIFDRTTKGTVIGNIDSTSGSIKNIAGYLTIIVQGDNTGIVISNITGNITESIVGIFGIVNMDTACTIIFDRTG